jgi:glycosyltransferase involved in cell wall biosynthesis
MQRILYFTPNYAPHNNAAAVRSGFIIKYLKERGYNITSLSGNQTSADKTFFFLFPSNKRTAYFRLLKQVLCGFELFFRVLFSSYDKYIFSTPPFVTVVIGCTACWIKGAKYIVDVRDLYPEAFYELKLLKRNSKFAKILNYLTRITYSKSEHVFTTSQGQLDQVLKYDDSISASVVRNGFDPELFKASAEKFDEFTVIFHGNLGHFQDIDLLLEIAKETYNSEPEIKFIIAGDGPNKSMVQNYSLPNLEYKGQVDHKEINKIISKSHLGISIRTGDLVSRTAIPVKVYEYIGACIPIIQAPFSEATDIINNNGIGHGIENGNPHIISEKVVSLFKDKNHYNEVSNNIYSCRDLFTRTQSANLFTNQLKNL